MLNPQYKSGNITTQHTMSTERQWSSIKEEYDEKQYTNNQKAFRCSNCKARYPNSTLLVHHMREEHLQLVEAKIARTPDKLPTPLNTDRYQNTTATCPFCQHDCHTRKKLMRHLELQHKDDNEEQEEPNVKVIRIDEQNKHKLLEQLHNTGPFVTPGASESKMVQNLLKAIGTPNSTITAANSKVDSKTSNKLQYKCFWCDGSFRKRGKLMDHIDTLHKHNKQQNQAEADMLSMDDPNKSQFTRQLIGHRNMTMSQLDLPTYPSGLQYATVSHHNPAPHRSPLIESRPSASNVSRCSFTLAGSLVNKSKPQVEDSQPSNNCKFYLGKKDNPLANTKPSSMDTVDRNFNQRRFSLPNLMEGASASSPYSFPYRMLPSTNSVAAAMQQSYMMNIQPSLLNATQFYAPRMQMMIPTPDYLVNHAHPMLDHQSQSTQHAQLMARMNHALAQMSPLARPKPTESPLDLTKSHIM